MENTWIEVDASEYADMDAERVLAVEMDGRREFVLLHAAIEQNAVPPMWQYYVVLHQDAEGFGGLEHIDSFETLEQAKAAADRDVRQRRPDGDYR